MPGDGVVGTGVRPPWPNSRCFVLSKSVYFRTAGGRHAVTVRWVGPGGVADTSEGQWPYPGDPFTVTTVASGLCGPLGVGEWSATLYVDGVQQGTTYFGYDGQATTEHDPRPPWTWQDPL